MNSPTPQTIQALRKSLGLTQKEAADAVHVTLRAWQWWESGKRVMPFASWELCVIKAGLHPVYQPVKSLAAPPSDPRPARPSQRGPERATAPDALKK